MSFLFDTTGISSRVDPFVLETMLRCGNFAKKTMTVDGCEIVAVSWTTGLTVEFSSVDLARFLLFLLRYILQHFSLWHRKSAANIEFMQLLSDRVVPPPETKKKSIEGGSKTARAATKYTVALML